MTVAVNLDDKKIKMNYSIEDYSTLKHMWKVSEVLNGWPFPVRAHYHEDLQIPEFEPIGDWTIKFYG